MWWITPSDPVASRRHVRPYRTPTAREQKEGTIPGHRDASWVDATAFAEEDDVLRRARVRASELGVTPVGPGVGATLRLLAATLHARAVVEIGTGVGVSGTWLLRGMRHDGVLTTIDTRPEHHQAARETFVAAGYAASRARLIPGRAVDVLPRLADGGYDMVFCDSDKRGYGECLDEAIRLLRPHGLLAVNDAMPRDRIADPTFRDPETLALRGLHRAIHEDDRLLPALLPVGDGLLCAVRR